MSAIESILVVDDAAMARNTVEALLEPQGYRILHAADGAAAQAVAKREKPSAILLDVMMPGMDGFVACRHLHDDPDTRHIPVILLSALSPESTEARGFAAGAIAVIAKPVDVTELRRVLRAALHGAAER